MLRQHGATSEPINRVTRDQGLMAGIVGEHRKTIVRQFQFHWWSPWRSACRTLIILAGIANSITTAPDVLLRPFSTSSAHGCKCSALLHFVSVASDASASSGTTASLEGRDRRGQAMEDNMQPWTI